MKVEYVSPAGRVVGGRYDVRLVGEGAGIANRVESSGRWQDGRWAPLRST